MSIKLHQSIIIGIVAGEISGDILGARLMYALKKCTKKKIYFFGIGGAYMKSENMESWYDIQELSSMGLVEIVTKLPKFLKIIRNLTNRFLNLNIDVFIGIDFPDFNLVLEKRLKKNGIRVIHYVSPSIWAWREKRILKIKNFVDNVLLIFPFEKEIYDYFNIPSTFIGHPLADKIPLYPNKNCMRRKLGISKDTCCLALLPGSRIREVQMLAEDFLRCAELLNNYVPNLEILMPLVHPTCIKKLIHITSKVVKLRVFDYKFSQDVMMASDIALLASGTATLECMLAKCPMVVAYRMHPITFLLMKKLIKISYISLPNLLAGYNLVAELIQHDCRPEKLLDKLLFLLNYDSMQRIVLINKFRQLHYEIKKNADIRAAYAILKLI